MEAASKAVDPEEGLASKDAIAAKDKKLYVARAQKKAERTAKLKAKFDEVCVCVCVHALVEDVLYVSLKV